jgi:hypothetical protein
VAVLRQREGGRRADVARVDEKLVRPLPAGTMMRPALTSARWVVVRFCMKNAGRIIVQPRPEARRRFSMP